MEKFNGWYKGAQVYLVPQGKDYLYKKAYAESGAAANTGIASYDSWVSDGKKQCVFVKFNPCEEKNADNKEKAKSAYMGGFKIPTLYLLVKVGLFVWQIQNFQRI